MISNMDFQKNVSLLPGYEYPSIVPSIKVIDTTGEVLMLIIRRLRCKRLLQDTSRAARCSDTVQTSLC